ncbi:hypothetical protein SEVIR_7G042505v4 [Setaria viridis]|uniref:Secreted protein n=1 Tax=Setaria viridis TaxID=4556 RepID=A0A4U6TPS8_SETVI|nr:hypothetical protein SEVIR_7G042505v2 [Setaria viridis]
MWRCLGLLALPASGSIVQCLDPWLACPVWTAYSGMAAWWLQPAVSFLHCARAEAAAAKVVHLRVLLAATSTTWAAARARPRGSS